VGVRRVEICFERMETIKYRAHETCAEEYVCERLCEEEDNERVINKNLNYLYDVMQIFVRLGFNEQREPQI